jgi:hypothetical protein
MKLTILFTLLISSSIFCSGQSTEIIPGGILPKMTSSQRNSITTPSDGMLVFDTEMQKYFYYADSLWITLSTDNYWTKAGFSGNEIKNTNTNGFWSENPNPVSINADDITNPPTAPISGHGTRLMWIPNRSAFRVGTFSSDANPENIGLFSTGIGTFTKASGKHSVSIGFGTEASNMSSTAIGYYARATGINSTAFGGFTSSTQYGSVAMGFLSRALNGFAFTVGHSTIASGEGSASFGFKSHAQGNYSFSAGDSSISSGNASVALGNRVLSIGNMSLAVGRNSQAAGDYSVAMGHNAKALGWYSLSVGINTVASGSSSIAFGSNSSSIGNNSSSFGTNTKAQGNSSVAMGHTSNALGDYSIVYGYNSTASGIFSSSFGVNTLASGSASVAMGGTTVASGSSSVAIGFRSTASGNSSTTLGYNNIASGDYSTALGSLVNSNNKNGSFLIGDEYTNAIPLEADEENRFLSRFRNGYYLYTTHDNSLGVRINSGESSWSTISDSTKKEKFISANTQNVLKSIAEMRVGTWNYVNQKPEKSRHWGIMAQDFHKHFGKDKYGTIGNDTTISTADFDGVIFAAVKGLIEENQALKNKNEQLETALKIAQNDIDNIKNKNEKLTLESSHLTNKFEELNLKLNALIDALKTDKDLIVKGE